MVLLSFFFFQAEDGIRDSSVTGVQTCALPIYTAASAISNLARQFALANNGGAPTNYYQGFPTTAQIGSVTAAMLGQTAQYWVDMLPKLRPGAAQYQDRFPCFIPSTAHTTGVLLHSWFTSTFNPPLS